MLGVLVFVSHLVSFVCGAVTSRHGFEIVITEASFKRLTDGFRSCKLMAMGSCDPSMEGIVGECCCSPV